MVRSQGPNKPLVGLNWDPSNSECNALNHQAILPYIWVVFYCENCDIYWFCSFCYIRNDYIIVIIFIFSQYSH